MYDNFDLIWRVMQTSKSVDKLMKSANSHQASVKISFKKHVMSNDIIKSEFCLEESCSSDDACDVYVLLHRVMEIFKANISRLSPFSV